MNKTELNAYRRELQALAARLRGEMRGLNDIVRRQSHGAAYDGSPADQADMAGHESEEMRAIGVLDTERQMLNDVIDALVRVENGDFGRCADCEKPISKKRLSAIPYARCCIDCATRQEALVYG